MIGHVSEFSDTGDFKVFNMANESAIIVRSPDGNLKAFANVCRHRGSLVCLEQSGTIRKFSCPYHGWVYDLNGNLIQVRDMPDDFDKKDYGLHGLSLDIVHGLVFICFSGNPPSLESAKKELKGPMSDFDFENMKVAASKMYPIEANWKLSIENYQECYHCATAHPEYAKMHTMMLDREKRERMQNHMYENMIACGLRDLEIEKTNINAPSGEQGYEYSRTALFKGYKTGSRDGEPVAPLLGKLKDYDGGASDLSIGPFSFLLAYSDHVVCYVFSPVDQNNSQCEIYWLVRGDAEEGKDYNKEELMYLWDITTEADKEIIVNNRKGVESRYYQSGPFSGMERQEKIFIEWILRELTAKI